MQDAPYVIEIKDVLNRGCPSTGFHCKHSYILPVAESSEEVMLISISKVNSPEPATNSKNASDDPMPSPTEYAVGLKAKMATEGIIAM